MKTRIFIVTLLLVVASVGASAQSKLFKGITSGMTKEHFKTYVNSTADIELVDDETFKTDISGRTYIGVVIFNSQNQLYSACFLSMDEYEWVDYDPNVKENAIELYSLLKSKYGEPELDRWLNWTEIPDGKSKVVAGFKKSTIRADLYVTEKDEKYYVSLLLSDEKYQEEEEEESVF